MVSAEAHQDARIPTNRLPLVGRPAETVVSYTYTSKVRAPVGLSVFSAMGHLSPPMRQAHGQRAAHEPGPRLRHDATPHTTAQPYTYHFAPGLANRSVKRLAKPFTDLRPASRLLAILAMLQILDLTSTLLLLSIGGIEANPMSSWLLRHGALTFIGAKVGLALVIGISILQLERDRNAQRSKAVRWTAIGFDLVYGLAVVSNLLQFALFA